MQKITNEKIQPNAKKLYQTFIPASGHTQSDAIFDLFDNCIDADAREIKLQIFSSDGGKIEKYRIIDDGCGMNEEQLIKSYQFANDSDHVKGSMGKYGIGGTTAAFSLGECKKVYTKQRNESPYVSYQDLTEEEFGVNIEELNLDQDNSEFFEICKDQGTIVEISKLRQEKKYEMAAHLKNFLVKEIAETYRYFLNTKKIYVEVIDKKGKVNTSTSVQAADPMHWNSSSVLHRDEKKYNIAGCDFSLRFVQLDPTKVEKDSISQDAQGFYFVRNNRQIIGGAPVKDIWSNHPTHNHQRIEFRFHEDLDKHVGLTATKNKISLSQSICDKIKADVKFFRNTFKQVITPLETDVKEIQNELEQFSKRLEKNGAALGAPKSKKETIDAKKSPAKNNTGTILPKNTDITRKPPQEPSRVVAKFEILSMIGDTHVSYNIENSQAKVYINANSQFIKDNYINATSEAKRQLENYWAAVAITLYQEFDEGEREFDICKDYANKVTQMIAKIHQLS